LIIIMGSAGAAISAVMAAAWWVQRRTGNRGWVDVLWSFGTGGIAMIAAIAPTGGLSWPQWRQIVVGALVALWCLRLGLHLFGRSASIGDDPRYRQLLAQWAGDAQRRMFWFLQSQAGVSVILVLAVVVAARNPATGIRVQDVAGIAILLAAIIGEAVADRQLRRFGTSGGGRTAVCDIGLWRLSRHPNYFFEWLGWLAYPVIAIDLSGHDPYGWLAVLAPLSMYWVLVHVSGIPPLEDHMVRTRGEAYRAYQRKTRAFFPIPKL
jgi:steroid 5-alpha reductase family enzyme